MKYYITLLLLLLRFAAYAQSGCDCEAYLKAPQTIDKAKLGLQLIQSKNKLCIAKGNELLGTLLDETFPDSAEAYLLNAEAIYTKLHCNDSCLLTTYKFLAGIYYSKSDFGKVQVYNFKLLKAAEHANNIDELVRVNTMIAQTFNQTNQAEKGIIYTRKAYALIPQIKDIRRRAHFYWLTAKRYLWHYQDTHKKGSLDTSEALTYESMKLARSISYRPIISLCYSNLQGIQWELEQFSEAMRYLDSAMCYVNRNNKDDLRSNYFDKADLYIEMKNYKAAAQCADSALYYDLQINNPAYLNQTYELVARIARLNNDYKLALEATLKAKALTDSMHTVENSIAVAAIEKKYNQAKNEAIIKDLSRIKQLYLLLAIIALLAVIATAFYIRQQNLNHRKNILETEQRLNRARMNPHFFFNALSALQKLAMKQGNELTMANNLSKFSHIMRETLESTYKDYVTIEQEIDFLTNYLEVQKMRFPVSFEAELNYAPSLEIDELLLPSMIIQPFVENAIEHGFSGIDYPGIIKINFELQGKELLVTIQDNGKGLSTKANDNNQHISRASQIIKDRIYLLNIKLKTKAGFTIENGPDKGVWVRISLPVLYKEHASSN